MTWRHVSPAGEVKPFHGLTPKARELHRRAFRLATMKFSEAIRQFKLWRGYKVKATTVKGYDMILRQFCVYVHDCNIEHIRLEDITTWFNLMQRLEWDINSFIGKAMALRKFFEFFRKQGYPVIDPWLIPVPQKQYKLPRVADEANYKKLLSAIPTKTNDPRHIRNRAIINMLWDTGARNGEVLALDVDDLQLDRMRAIINTEKSKGRRPFRELFWTAETNESIKCWLKKREDLKKKMTFAEPEALFISVCSGGLSNASGRRLNLKGVGELLRRYSNKAKIPIMNAHSFRHHMGHDIVKKGGSAADVMNILGHASLASSSIYTMMTDKELEARYRQFKGG